MPKIDLKAKLGPLPVWGWGIIVGVLALIGYFVWQRRGGGTSSGNDAASPGGSNLDALGYQTSGFGAKSDETSAYATPENNVSWLTRVSRQVADTLAASPSEVYAALYKWISGQDITQKEKGYVDKAIQVGMNPPEGTQGVSNVLPGATTTPVNGMTLTEQKVYYVPKNKAWGLLGPNGIVRQTANQEIANAWGREIGQSQAIYVEPETFQAIADANRKIA